MTLPQPPSAPANAMDMRRHQRQPVLQEATLKTPGLADIPCEIRDFCRGGVFLLLKNGMQGFHALQARGIQQAEIRFTPRTSTTSLQLRGRIAHLSANGVGIAFSEQPPAAALLALQESTQDHPSTQQPPAGPDGKAFDAKLIQGTCRQALEELLPGVLGDFFGQVGQSLLEAAEKAGTNAEQAAYFEAIAQLKTHRPQLENRFCTRVLEQAGSFSAADLHVYPEPYGTAGLALVDNSEFEDWLNLSEAIAKTENLHEAELQVVEQRLSRLAHREINKKNNPYGPGILGHAFRSEIDALNLQNPAKRIVYRVFARALNPRLSTLYLRLDQITQILAGNAPAPTAPKRVPAGETPSTPEARQELQSQPLPEQRPQAQPSGVLQTAGLLWELCGQTRPAARQASPAESADAPDRFAVLSALQQIQAAKLAQNVDYIASQTLQAQLAHALAAHDKTAGAGNLSHKQTLDILVALLDNVLAESTVAADVKSCYQKLQIPLLEAVVADPALLHSDSHPAREVLNLIDHLSIAANDKGEIENKALRQSLSTITDRIVREAANNPAVFEEAREQLEKLTAPLLKARAVRIDRVREACEGGQRIKAARRLVEREIDARIGGKTVAAAVPALLDSGWRQLLILAALRHGFESTPWNQQMGVVDKLQGWLASERSERPPTLLEAHLLIDFVDEHLLTVCPDQAALNRIIEDLTALLLGVGNPKEKRPPEFVFIPAAEKGEEGENRLAESEHLKQFRVGDWLKFSLRPGVETPMRLTWIGEDPASYVFVNHKGGKEIELSPQEFSRYLSDNRAAKTESLDLPLMERTANTLVQTMQDRLQYQASHDPVTGLINRKEFIRRLDRHFARHDRQDARHMLGLMEIDQLRIINNLCGTEAGDQLLQEISGIMKERLNGNDILARFGDSHFGLLLGRCTPKEGHGRAEDLLQAIRHYHFKWGERSFSLGVNVGLVACEPGQSDVDALIKNADAACLAAREKGPGQIQLYADGDVTLATQKNIMDWAGRINQLLAENRLFVRCQMIAPIFPERDRHSHHEILLGIRDEHGNIVSPAEFVPAAERWQRMSEIDRWQVQSVFRWIQQNDERFRQIGGFAINLSGQSLKSDDFLAFLHGQFSTGDLPAEKITFEITETAAIDEFSQAEKFIRQIKRYGCKFSLDDFGSGFSSYSYLKNLQVDYLKIDGSFVKDLASSPTDYAMVKSMNEIGHSLGMKTIAEYVENDAILDKLREIGVDYAQGYGIGKPVTIEDVA